MDFEVEGDGLFKHNDTYEYDDNYEYNEELEFTDSTAVLFPLLYSAVLVVGLPGNGLLLTTLFRKRHSWNISDTFVLHLCIADVLLLLTLPLWIGQAVRCCAWEFGLMSCKINRVIFYVNFYCGIFLLACLILDCYMSCCRAAKIYSKSRPSFAHMTCLCVWICSLILVTPKWIFVVTSTGTGKKKTLCVENYSASSTVGQLVSRLFHHMLGFLLPTAILIICLSCVALRLHRSSKKLQKQRAFMVFLCLVGVFLLCWMPYNIMLIVDTVRSRSEETETFLKTTLMVTSLFGYIHTCLRPFVFLSLDANFRTQALSLLRCSPVEPVSSLWQLGVGEDDQTQPDHNNGEQEQMTIGDHQMQSSQC